MVKENISQKFRLKKLMKQEIWIEEINGSDLMSKKHKNVCATLNYIEKFIILGFTLTGCISTSAFASLFVLLIGITNSAIGLKSCAITAAIKRYKSIVKQKKKQAW